MPLFAPAITSTPCYPSSCITEWPLRVLSRPVCMDDGCRVSGVGYRVSGIGSYETFEVNRMALRSYRELEVWQRAMDLVEAVYHPTEYFPGEEKFGLTSQIRRAAVSIPA